MDFGTFVLGITYGSMIDQIGGFVESSPTISKLFNIDPHLANEASKAASKAMIESFMSTIFMICAVMVACFAVTSLMRLVTEERKIVKNSFMLCRLAVIKFMQPI